MAFEFPIRCVGPDGYSWQEPGRAPKSPEQWTIDDLADVLRAAAAYVGIDFSVAFAHVERDESGTTIRIGTTEAGTAAIGPLPIENDVAHALVQRAGWFQYEDTAGKPS